MNHAKCHGDDEGTMAKRRASMGCVMIERKKNCGNDGGSIVGASLC